MRKMEQGQESVSGRSLTVTQIQTQIDVCIKKQNKYYKHCLWYLIYSDMQEKYLSVYLTGT